MARDGRTSHFKKLHSVLDQRAKVSVLILSTFGLN